MLCFKSLLVLLFSVLLSQTALAAFHFTEIYSDGNIWRVDHFKAEKGELQELVESRTFKTQFEAKKFSNVVKSSPKTIFKFTTTEQGVAPLWKVTNEWNQDWEIKYGQWVGANFKRDFFIKHKLATDCADVAYALRWIFSRNNQLPAAATLAGSGVNASHLSAKSEWDALPTHTDWDKDQRFLAGLDWLLNSVYTKTLYLDAYPVEISKATIMPGLINLLGGHTEIFSHVSYNPEEVPLEVLSSTMPRAVRELAARPFTDSSVTEENQGGLLRFRWPLKSQNWVMLPKEEMPYYSREQYSKELCVDEPRFAFCMFKKLGMTFQPELILKKILDGIVSTVKLREEIVRNGFNFCQVNDCSPGTQAWEDWSTPTRDGRLLATLLAAQETAYSIEQGTLFDEWSTKEIIPVENVQITYEELRNRLRKQFVSFDPRTEIESRWAANTNAIFRHVKSYIAEVQKVRTELVTKAQPCRDNPKSCQDSKKLFQEFSTLEIDYKLRHIISNWTNYCKFKTCPQERLLNEIFDRVWFQSPAPWDDLAVRNGTQKSTGHLLKASSVQPAGNRFIILDFKRLYDFKTREEIIPPLEYAHSLGFDDYTKQIYTFNGETFSFHDEDFNFTEKFETGLQATEGSWINSLGEGKYFLVRPITPSGPSPYPPVGMYGWVIDFVHKTISEKITFDAMDFLADKKFLLKGSVNQLLYLKAGKVVFKELPDLPGAIGSFIVLSENNFLLSVVAGSEGHSSVYTVENENVQRLLDSESPFVLFERLNSNFVYMQVWGSDSNGYLLDNDFNFYFKDSPLQKGISAGTDSHLILREKNSGKYWQGILLNGKSVQETNIILDEYTMLSSASEDWVSYVGRDGYTVANYQNQILEQHPFKGKSQCHSGGMHVLCAGNPNLLVEAYDSPLESMANYNLLHIGLGTDWTMEKSLSYSIIHLWQQQGGPNEEGEFQKVLMVETGTGIRLADSLMLWFPEL